MEDNKNKFCTAINCMDGRVQSPVIELLRKKFHVEYVDIITEPGPNLILARQDNNTLVKSIITRLKISVEKHNSKGIALTGHYDCAGNPAEKKEQIQDIKKAVVFLHKIHKPMPIIGLWIDEKWNVKEIY